MGFTHHIVDLSQDSIRLEKPLVFGLDNKSKDHEEVVEPPKKKAKKGNKEPKEPKDKKKDKKAGNPQHQPDYYFNVQPWETC